MDENNFDAEINKVWNEKVPNFDGKINIAVIGKVSAGKSSLINAILRRDRTDPIAEVGALSGVTTKIAHYPLGDHVLIIDSPGLDDIRDENSQVTKDFLDNIDLGVFVVNGSADAAQKSNYDDLVNKSGNKVLLILNKIDEWDNLEESAYLSVIQQWKSTLGAEKIFGTSVIGYDPKFRKDIPITIRGIEAVREEIFGFLKKNGKDLLFARYIKSKENYALGIIGAALVSVAAEAFIPGSAIYITATQAVAITSLYYLYTGKVYTKTTALALLPTFAGQSIGMTVFLWVKSILPPTGVVDVAAAGIAVTITFAMLAAVKWMLENDYTLDNTDKLIEVFNKYKALGGGIFDTLSLSDFKDKEIFTKIVQNLLKANKIV